MVDKFSVLFASGVVIDGAIFVLALMLVICSEFRSKAYWLLGYAISAIYGDYNLGIEMRDKALGSSLATTITLPPTLDFIVDLFGRIALLVAIWMFFALLKKWGNGVKSKHLTLAGRF
jgi:hypothetical protein